LRLADGLVRFNQSSDFLQEHLRVLLRWFHQRLAIVFTEVLSEEVWACFEKTDSKIESFG
jgi:hypothetical protein